jgi:plastocyanin
VEREREIGVLVTLTLSMMILSTTILLELSIGFSAKGLTQGVGLDNENIKASPSGTYKYDELVNDTVVNENMQITPGSQSKAFTMSVPGGGFGARLVGSYSIKGGSVPAIHLYVVDASKCAIPYQPSSCSSYIIDQISSNSYINMSLSIGKTYNLFFLNEANVASEVRSVSAKLFLEHYPFSVNIMTGQTNNTISLNQFFPSKIEVKIGQSITWYNPSQVAEPRTVTLVLDGKYKAGVFAPFSVPNTTKLISIPLGSNTQPTLLPGQNRTSNMITLNERAFKPTVIESSGIAKFLTVSKLSANYTVNGNEKYINSGFLLPTGKEGSFPSSLNTFTVKFNKAGRYDYFDIFHPWMKGRITVR